MKIDYTLYVCTDRTLMSTPTLSDSVEQSIIGGATLIQYRDKDASGRQLYETASELKQITDRYGVPLIINDRIDIAIAVDAAGVHLGQGDVPAAVARKMLGADKIIGVSAARVEEAVQAGLDGADYIGVGAMFATATKTNARAVSRETLMEIRAAVSMPMVAIGGIKRENLSVFSGTGIDGVAVVSAVIAQPDVAGAAADMRRRWHEDVEKGLG